MRMEEENSREAAEKLQQIGSKDRIKYKNTLSLSII